MSGWFITVLITGLFAVIALIVRGTAQDEESKGVAALAVTILVLLGAVFTLIASATVVQTRSVGVITSFGKPIGSLTNGGHMVRPWANVEKFDASVQTMKLDGTWKKDKCEGGVTVRLGNQTTACVDVSVQWNIDPNGDIIDLYRKYKNFGNIEDNLVKRQLQRAMNTAFADFDPLKTITGDGTATASLDMLASKAKTVLVEGVGKGIRVLSVVIPIVHFDAATEGRLREYQQALANTRIAEANKRTAEAVRAANEILAGSSASRDPGVQYQRCLDLMRELAAQGKLGDLPETFTCNQGSGTPVIVQTK